MSNITDHLDFLFGNDKGFVYSPIKQKDGTWTQKWFSYPLERGNLIDWIQSESHTSDVYLAPALWKEKKISLESFDHSNVVWVEFDGQHAPQWNKIPAPDYIVRSSVETHQHCYWKVAEPITSPQVVEDINRRLTYYLEADGSGWDYQQVLRPPDTVNYKHNLVTQIIKSYSGGNHDLSNFDAAPTIERAPDVFVYDDLLPVEPLLRRKSIDEKTMKMVLQEIVLHPHRSEFLMRVGYELAENGYDPLEIVSCLYHIDSRIKKFVGRDDQLRRLSEIASIATFKVERTLFASVYSPMEILNHAVDLEWIVPGFLHTTGFLIITGQPGVGKTSFSLDMMYNLAVGKPVMRQELKRPYRCGFLSLEMDVFEIKYFLAQQSKDYEAKELWNSNVAVIAPDIDDSMSGFEKTLKELNLDILFIDSISEMATEDLDLPESKKIVKWIRRASKVHNLAVIAIHHNRKASDANKKPRKLSDLYGSFIFAKASDTVLSLWHEEGRELIELDPLKARYTQKKEYRLKRSSNLTYSFEAEINVSIEPKRDDPVTTIFNFD